MLRIDTYNLVSRKGWSKGPWDTEPDKMQWQDKETGLPCLINRNRMGAWCGYVGVSKGHPFYNKHYDKAGELDIHGGLTYADKCTGSVCHEVEEGEDDDVWWLGFDCCHYRDHAPGATFLSGRDPVCQYRNQAYVTRQVELLAKQLWRQSNA